MKTITIEDPKEVSALLEAEYPDALATGASFNARGWVVFAVSPGENKETCRGSGATAGEAFADLRAKITEADPINRLRREAKKLGYDLMPADS